MFRLKITPLSPIHIGTGDAYIYGFNLLKRGENLYLYDEFDIAQYFIDNAIAIPSVLEELKKEILKNKEAIIDANIHKRVVKNSFKTVDKELLEHVCAANHPIISGSSIKGAIRTAIFDCFYKQSKFQNNPKNCYTLFQNLNNKNIEKERFYKSGRVADTIDEDFIKLLRHFKISDTVEKLDTKCYKTINIKKNKAHQERREYRVEEISVFVEAIMPNQTAEFLLSDTSDEMFFGNIGKICNDFYIPFFNDELGYYFSNFKINKEINTKIKNLNNHCFLLNLGKYSGAERKSLNEIRWIKGVKENDKSKTTARTYALEKEALDTTYFEKELLPFGWVLCEYIGDIPNTTETGEIIEIARTQQIDEIKNYLARLKSSKIKRVYYIKKITEQLSLDSKTIDMLVQQLSIVLQDGKIEPDDLSKLLITYIQEEFNA